MGVLVALPMFSSAGLLEDVQRGVQDTVTPVQQTLERALTPPAQQVQKAPAPAPAAAPQPAQTPGQGTYQPPLHGANPHGHGTAVVGDISPSEQRPLAGDPAGAGDGGQAREEIIVGRARGEEEADGTYHGHITIVSLFGNELLGVDTQDGQTGSGPLQALEDAVLTPICDATTICLDVLRADSTTTSSGSTNNFAVATATIGDPNAPTVSARAVETNGNISQDANCQTSHGDSTVADVNLAGSAVADVAQSSTDSRACNDGTQTQSNSSSVIGLGGTGIPLPVAGCADGTPDSAFTPLAPLASIVCNADDSAGTGEALAQAGVPYGVREALSIFALEAGGTALVKATTSASESRAEAPGGGGPTTPTDTPECSDGIDNDGDGLIDLADPDCDSPTDDSESGSSGPGGPGTDRETRGETECSDGRDNDGDGLIDLDDPDCESRSDDSEDGSARDSGAPECSDGIDNDGDGEIDFPDDPQCESRSDDSEGGGDTAGATARGDGDELPVTGVELLLIALLGAVTLAGGLALRRATESWEGRSAA
ncbi:MAG: hypothetical protein WD844_15140 [Thermoleophilaceae bacterium]